MLLHFSMICLYVGFFPAFLKSDFQIPLPIFYWKTKVMRKPQKYNSSFLNLKVKGMSNAICKSKAFLCVCVSVRVFVWFFFWSIWGLNSDSVYAQTKFSFYYCEPVITCYCRWRREKSSLLSRFICRYVYSSKGFCCFREPHAPFWRNKNFFRS